jgi:hypothetical protein
MSRAFPTINDAPPADVRIEVIDALLRKHGARSDASLSEDISVLLDERRTLRWRLSELQRLVEDDAIEHDGKMMLRFSRATMHFILTGRLPE